MPTWKGVSSLRPRNGWQANSSRAVPDVCRVLALADNSVLEAGRRLASRIVSMLITLIRRITETDPGTGKTHGHGQ